MGFFDNIKKQLKNRDLIVRLIIINVIVFLVLRIISLFYFAGGGGYSPIVMQAIFFREVISWLAVPADFQQLTARPWTLITYMFTQYDLMHILFNMLIFYWFGRLFQQFIGKKDLLSTYLLGGLFGALFFIIAYNIFPVFNPELPGAQAIGASASVMAIVFAVSLYAPDFTIHLLFIGRVKLKYIALFYLAMDLLFMFDGNAGGHIAHLGGACYGALFTVMIKRGMNTGSWLNNFQAWVNSAFSGKPRRRMRVKHKKPMTDMEWNEMKNKKQERIDDILDKVSKTGYNSLTKEEKEILFGAGKQNN